MKLGIILPVGGSLSALEKTGQLGRFLDYYLTSYRAKFDRIMVFSYQKEQGFQLPAGCFLVDNRWGLPRYLYSFLLPFLCRKELSSLAVIRVTQLSSIIPALIIKLLWGKRIVVTYGYDYIKFALAERKYLAAFFYLVQDLFLAKLADWLIFTNSSIYERKKNRLSNSVWLPNGVDTAVFKPKKKNQTKLFKVLAIGRLEPQKCFATLIEQITLLDQKKHDIKLTIIANGQLLLKPDLLRLAEDLGVRLEIIDKVSHKDLPDFYNSCDLFVLPSLVEGSSKVLLEAASCGCALLVRDLLENGDVVINEKTGLTFHRDEELGGKIAILMQDALLRESLGTAARELVRKDFDLKKILRKETLLLAKV